MDILIILISLLVLVGMVVLIGAFVDSKRFVVRTYEIPTNKIKEEYKFVVLSDLHNRKFCDEEKMIRTILNERPECIMVAGDMINGIKNGTFDHAIELLKPLAEKHRIYYGNGNHEYRLRRFVEVYGDLYEKYTDALKKMNIEPIINQTIPVEGKNISVIGSEIDRIYYKKWKKSKMEVSYLNEVLGMTDKDSFSVLIAHNPEYFEQYAEWGADLVLSGHIHGGIMRLPLLGGVISPSFRIFPKYDGGLYKKGKSTMVLSRGLGMHTIPIRIFNPGEIVVVKLIPS